MSLIITEECINCGACEGECPNEAITAGDDIYSIEPNKCTECLGFYETQQCVDVCPVACIPLDPNCKESREQLMVKYEKIHPGRPPEKVDAWQPPAE